MTADRPFGGSLWHTQIPVLTEKELDRVATIADGALGIHPPTISGRLRSQSVPPPGEPAWVKIRHID